MIEVSIARDGDYSRTTITGITTFHFLYIMIVCDYVLSLGTVLLFYQPNFLPFISTLYLNKLVYFSGVCTGRLGAGHHREISHDILLCGSFEQLHIAGISIFIAQGICRA